VNQSEERLKPLKVAVVIPCYRVADRVLDVLEAIPARVDRIFCVDDACPEKSGDRIAKGCKDARVTVFCHDKNQGVGGATITGYKAALEADMDVVVKIDGDGQMDPRLIPRFVAVLQAGEADYCKGNRFYRVATLTGMPKGRVVGNAVLSFLTKLSSGYWQVFDPTNGYTAIHAAALRLLPLEVIDRGYFFESDMLFRLNTIRAVVRDVPMTAAYKDETSNLKAGRLVLPFLAKNLRNLGKRLVYNYYVRDFNLASLEWPLGILLLGFGVIFGLSQWISVARSGQVASAGTVMLAALPVMVGIQMLLSAFNFDIQNVPRTPLQRLLRDENPIKSL
jgi:glycosyltransferase involved in cell wall biosynthesis